MDIALQVRQEVHSALEENNCASFDASLTFSGWYALTLDNMRSFRRYEETALANRHSGNQLSFRVSNGPVDEPRSAIKLSLLWTR